MDDSENQLELNGIRTEKNLELNEQPNTVTFDQLIRKYLKLKSIIERILDEELNANEEQLTNNVQLGRHVKPVDNKYFNLYDLPSSLSSSDRFSKRAYGVNGEAAYERLMKGKRVNKNMFSSGLQGVWGVPGKK